MKILPLLLLVFIVLPTPHAEASRKHQKKPLAVQEANTVQITEIPAAYLTVRHDPIPEEKSVELRKRVTEQVEKSQILNKLSPDQMYSASWVINFIQRAAFDLHIRVTSVKKTTERNT